MTIGNDIRDACGESCSGLVAGEAQLRVLLDNIPARVALLDRQRRHCYVNQEYAAYAGLPPEQMLGRTVTEFLGVRPYAALHDLGERALAGDACKWEGWVPHHGTGEPRFVRRYYVPYRGADGTVDGYFTLTRDLTDLKRSEQRLAEQVAALYASEALAAAITTAALDCVIVFDEAGRVVVFNPAAEATFGYRRGEVLGRPVIDLIVPPEARPAHEAAFRRHLAADDGRILGRRTEIQAMRADGSTFPAEIAITQVSLPDRRLFAAYLRDLTAAKQAEAQIRRQRETLHEVEKMAAFGSLLAGVAHELNNPLSIVIGHAQLLEEETGDCPASALADRAGKIRRAAERCGQTVRTFLAMARQRGLRRAPVAIDELVRATLDEFSDPPEALPIQIMVDVAPDLPLVRADRDQLEHVLLNLVDNARQALRDRPAPRRIRISASAASGMLDVVVADNGPGIAPMIRGRIFDPFFTTKQPGEGTGIGLAVSKGIAEAHGGTLTLDPNTRRGARFVLRLPVAEEPAMAEAGVR